MKKILAKLILTILCVCIACSTLFACGQSNWTSDSVTVKGTGDGASNGGFIATTNDGDYIYFINGVGDSTGDNTFGNAVKGSLVATKKDFSQTCVAVPKLITSADYNAGFYIYDGYVYYGTPSTDKDSSGSVAKTQMMITRTKLDGSLTETLFTVSTLDTQFRVVKSDNDVLVVYYDKENTALKCYNVTTKATVTIAKMDIKAESEVLDTFKIMPNGANFTIILVTKTYSEAYNQDVADASGTAYARAEEKYSKVYTFTAGDEKLDGEVKATLVIDGKKDQANQKYFDEKYLIDFVTDSYVFLTATDTTTINQTKKLVLSTEDLSVKTIKATSFAKNTSVIVSLEEVYSFETDRIKKANLITGQIETVALVSSVTTLYFVEGDYIYYLNTSNQLARIKVKNVDQSVKADINEQRVSASTITTDWYRPEIVDGKIYYIDNSGLGVSYVHYVDLSTTVTEEDTDDDDTADSWYLDGAKSIGKFSKEDNAKYVDARIADIANKLESGKLTDQAKAEVSALREEYNKLDSNDKKLINPQNEKTLQKYEKSIELETIVKNLKDFMLKSDTQKEQLKSYYESAKAMIESLKKNDDGIVLGEVTDLIETNLMADYQFAKKHFTK